MNFAEQWPRAWCRDCKAVVAVEYDEMSEGGQHGCDIICTRCRSIVATLHAAALPTPIVGRMTSFESNLPPEHVPWKNVVSVEEPNSGDQLLHLECGHTEAWPRGSNPPTATKCTTCDPPTFHGKPFKHPMIK